MHVRLCRGVCSWRAAWIVSVLLAVFSALKRSVAGEVSLFQVRGHAAGHAHLRPLLRLLSRAL